MDNKTMSLFRTNISPILALVIATGFTATVISDKFFTEDTLSYKHDNSIVMENKNDNVEYQKFRHLDGNLDGFITKKDIENADKFRGKPEAYEFAESLSSLDKRLVFGLTYDVAVQAVKNLNDVEKQALLKLDIPNRVNLMNSRFAG